MKTLLIILTLLFVTPTFAAYIDDDAPSFKGTTIDGKEVDSKKLIGKKTVLLVFWATWCPNCKNEIPTLKKIHNEYGDKIEVIAINVNMNDSLSNTKRYTNKYKLPYGVIYDGGKKIAKSYSVMGAPTNVIIDINGVIKYHSANAPQDIGKHLDMLLKKK